MPIGNNNHLIKRFQKGNETIQSDIFHMKTEVSYLTR